MTTRFEAVAARVAAVLTTAGLTVQRTRTRPESAPAVVVSTNGWRLDPDSEAFGVREWRQTVLIVAYAQATDARVAEQVVDQTVADIYEALHADTTLAMDGVTFAHVISADHIFEEPESIAVRMLAEIIVRTDANDITTAA